MPPVAVPPVKPPVVQDSEREAPRPPREFDIKNLTFAQPASFQQTFLPRQDQSDFLSEYLMPAINRAALKHTELTRLQLVDPAHSHETSSPTSVNLASGQPDLADSARSVLGEAIKNWGRKFLGSKLQRLPGLESLSLVNSAENAAQLKPSDMDLDLRVRTRGLEIPSISIESKRLIEGLKLGATIGTEDNSSLEVSYMTPAGRTQFQIEVNPLEENDKVRFWFKRRLDRPKQ